MVASSNHSAERALLLLKLLATTPEPVSRAEIFQRIAYYQVRDAGPDAQRKMLERDLNSLDICGFSLRRIQRSREIAYIVDFP